MGEDNTDDYFEVEKVFDPDDYLYFYEETLTEDRAETETDFLEEHLGIEEGDRVLDVPCGHGRISNRLAERGYDIVGIDITEGFLDIAVEDAEKRAVDNRTEYMHGDMRSIPFENDFDAAYNVFTSFGYFSEQENVEVLQQIHKSIKDGARFVLETMNRDYLVKNFESSHVHHVDDDILIEEHDFDVLNSRIGTEWTIIRGDERRKAEFSVRAYTYTEIENLLNETGFEVVDVYGGMDEEEYSVDANRMCVVSEAEKPS